MSTVIDLSGQRFGMLTVLRREGIAKQGSATWLCSCDCGNFVVASASHLTRRERPTISCGCYKRPGTRTHGRSKGNRTGSAYSSWAGMLSRCTNSNCSIFKHYGGRGISVCERWKSFEAFLEDMGERPSGMSLDRVDNNGNYCKENCRWATHKQQRNNQRSNRFLSFNGRSQTVAMWADEYGMKYHTLLCRIRAGLSVETALTRPIGRWI